MATFAERQAYRIIDHYGGPKAARIAQEVQKLAARQGGKTTAENYKLLGKHIVGAAALAAGGLAIGTVAAVAALSRGTAKRASKESRRIGRKGKTLPSGLREEDSPEGVSDEMINADALAPGFYRTYGKRAWDIAISAAAMPIVMATIGLCGIAIRREDGGPIFYNAPRIGKDGRPFMMYKLRTMKVDSPDLVMEDGSTYNGADDPRLTKVGSFLRKTSLDEIPQFLNVLKGDMSVVGPRPDLQREVDLYQGDESLKLAVKPGITGYAAVYGRNSLPWHERLALDIYYVLHLSFPLDAKIFFKTFAAVLKQDGIYVEEKKLE